jgi:hypothetical protein
MHLKTLASIVFFAGSLIIVNSAHAKNHCGSWRSGKFENQAEQVAVVKGDTRKDGVVRKGILKNQHANADLKICDADFYFRFSWWKWKKIFGATRAINKRLEVEVVTDFSRT